MIQFDARQDALKTFSNIRKELSELNILLDACLTDVDNDKFDFDSMITFFNMTCIKLKEFAMLMIQLLKGVENLCGDEFKFIISKIYSDLEQCAIKNVQLKSKLPKQ